MLSGSTAHIPMRGHHGWIDTHVVKCTSEPPPPPEHVCSRGDTAVVGAVAPWGPKTASEGWRAAGRLGGARAAAGCGVPMLQGASPRHTVAAWRRRRRGPHDACLLLRMSLLLRKEKEEGGGDGEGGEAATTEEDARLVLRSLIVVPASRRTAEQERRIQACSLTISAASWRKRKKTKKKLPRTGRRLLPHRGAWLDSGYRYMRSVREHFSVEPLVSGSHCAVAHLAVLFGVLVSPDVYFIWILLGDDFRICFRVQFLSVRQWILFMRQSSVAFGYTVTKRPGV